MSDAWTDRKQQCLINFFVNSHARTMFVKSIDGSKFLKIREILFEMIVIMSWLVNYWNQKDIILIGNLVLLIV